MGSDVLCLNPAPGLSPGRHLPVDGHTGRWGQQLASPGSVGCDFHPGACVRCYPWGDTKPGPTLTALVRRGNQLWMNFQDGVLSHKNKEKI